MMTEQTIPVAFKPHPADNQNQQVGNGLPSAGLSSRIETQTYLTTEEAASYLRKSVSWLVRQPDIPYLAGKPNTYKKTDLDDWFERHKFVPRVA